MVELDILSDIATQLAKAHDISNDSTTVFELLLHIASRYRILIYSLHISKDRTHKCEIHTVFRYKIYNRSIYVAFENKTHTCR